jgi:electron transport complex protein RnfC
MLRLADQTGIDTILINGLVAEPEVTRELLALAESSESVINGARWLRCAYGTKRISLVLDRACSELIGRYRAAIRREPIELICLSNKYPQASPCLLVKSVLQREITRGRSTLDARVLVLNASAVAALAHGHPCATSTMAIMGEAAEKPGHYRVPIGTTFADIISHVGLRATLGSVIEGGCMTGRPVATLDTVVTQETSTLLLRDRASQRIPRPGPCVCCGWCQDDCPVGLDPAALLDACERGDERAALNRYVDVCVDCGLCSYVCPSELPLAESISSMKRRVTLERPGRGNGDD